MYPLFHKTFKSFCLTTSSKRLQTLCGQKLYLMFASHADAKTNYLDILVNKYFDFRVCRDKYIYNTPWLLWVNGLGKSFSLGRVGGASFAVFPVSMDSVWFSQESRPHP